MINYTTGSPICPYCEVTLKFDEILDTANYGDSIDITESGYCPKCGRTFYWEQEFVPSRFHALEEIEDEGEEDEDEDEDEED